MHGAASRWLWEAPRVTNSDMGPVQQVRGRLQRFGAWRRDLTDELVQLPATLRRLREGAANFELVGQRLAASSEALEEITRVYRSAVGDSTRRSAEMADQLRRQLDSLAEQPPDVVKAAVDEFQRGFDALTELNPFLGRRRPPAD